MNYEQENDISTVASITRDIQDAEDHYRSIFQRCKRDLQVANGIDNSQYSERDTRVRGEDRAQFSFPVIDKYVERVIGNYNLSPFGIKFEAMDNERVVQARLLSTVIKGIENKSNAKDIYRQVLRGITTYGYGWVHVTTEYDNPEDDSLDVSIKLEYVNDYSSVLQDPKSQATNGSDARWRAHVDYLTPSEAKATYGEDCLESSGESALFDSDLLRHSIENVVPLVTYYSKEEKKEQVFIDVDGKVSNKKKKGYSPKLKTKQVIKCTKLVGNTIVFEQELKGLTILPLVPCYGLPVYNNGKMQSVGIVHRAIDTQTLLNYSGSLAAERLALSPKANYIVDFGSIRPFFENWKNSAKSTQPVLPFNSKDPKTGEQYIPPMKQDLAVNISDVSTLQQQYISIIGDIIGMPNEGMSSGGPAETAEAVLTRTKSAETILSTLYENLGSTISEVGRVALQMIVENYNTIRTVPIVKDGKMGYEEIDFEGLDINPREMDVIVSEGPMSASQRKENLKSLLAVIQISGPSGLSLLPEVVANIDLDDEDESIKTKVNMIAQQVVDSGQKDQQIAEMGSQLAQSQQQSQVMAQQLTVLQGELNKQQASVASTQIKSQSDILKTQLNNEARMDLERLRQGGDMVENKQQAELDAEAMILKERIELEKNVAREQARLATLQPQINSARLNLE
jgi:hypothetical protein